MNTHIKTEIVEIRSQALEPRRGAAFSSVFSLALIAHARIPESQDIPGGLAHDDVIERLLELATECANGSAAIGGALENCFETLIPDDAAGLGALLRNLGGLGREALALAESLKHEQARADVESWR